MVWPPIVPARLESLVADEFRQRGMIGSSADVCDAALLRRAVGDRRDPVIGVDCPDHRVSSCDIALWDGADRYATGPGSVAGRSGQAQLMAV
ncbi:hypothetical protein GCM10009677_63370 [Sphaerisporangium rubeum]